MKLNIPLIKHLEFWWLWGQIINIRWRTILCSHLNFLPCYQDDMLSSCDGRVVKALDSKSNGIFMRRFESCSQRHMNFKRKTSKLNVIKLTTNVLILLREFLNWYFEICFWFNLYSKSSIPEVGFEPTRTYVHWILSPTP